jgi:hypothetical protein
VLTDGDALPRFVPFEFGEREPPGTFAVYLFWADKTGPARTARETAPTSIRFFTVYRPTVSTVRTSMRALAAAVDEAGFWPVTRRPSTTAKGAQSAAFS